LSMMDWMFGLVVVVEIATTTWLSLSTVTLMSSSPIVAAEEVVFC
jgi:hypothetical protein